MALGYGSEFQLMRFLGHHRNYLDGLIRDAVGVGHNTPVEWIDYPYNSSNTSGDGEWIGVECFKDRENYKTIKREWKKYWPQRGKTMNWDGIFRIGSTWYFVEAKANKPEAHQDCNASAESSIEKIKRAFSDTIEWLKSDESKEWITSDCYQLANRFAFIQFCKEKIEIDARLMYINFCNDRNKYSVSSENEWKKIWEKEYETLGIDEDLFKDKLYHIYPDCTGEGDLQ